MGMMIHPFEPDSKGRCLICEETIELHEVKKTNPVPTVGQIGQEVTMHTCSLNHISICFMAIEREACPSCADRRMLQMQEDEINDLVTRVEKAEHRPKHRPEHRAVRMRIRSNPKFRRDRTKSDVSILVIGLCIGFIAGIFKKKETSKT